MSLYKKDFGTSGEKLACSFLKSKGFSILIQNYRSYMGEIDVIAQKNKTLYFIEVKSRANLDKGQPYEAVNSFKIYNMKQASQMYLLHNPHKDYKLKLAVISIVMKDDNADIKFFDDID